MQEKNNSQVNLLDLFFYLLGRWYWFVLCVTLCVGVAYYQYAKMPMIYRSDATVIIKDPSNTRTAARLDNYSGLINKVIMSNEILQLKSKRLMGEVVTALDADVSYTIHDRLRDIELYSLAPLRVSVDRSPGAPDYFRFKVQVQEKGALLVETDSGKHLSLRVGDSLSLAGTKIHVQPTTHYNEYVGQELTVTKVPVQNAAASYLSRLKIQQSDEDASILSLSQQDYSVHRASDILNMLVDKYNEDAIREKNRIVVNTAAFINERLVIIQEELGEVEDHIADFKVAERIMSVDAAASQYLNESNKFSAEIVEIEGKMKLASYLEEYLRYSFQIYETIPVNAGLEDPNLNASISEYNRLIIQRERLIEESSYDSPAVKQIEAGLQTLRSNILAFITNLEASLAVNKRELAEREQEALKSFTAMPLKARKLLSIERQQKIKESLYVFLLNKREENALTQAMVDNNARMIDWAVGSGTPIYPDRNKMLLLGFLLGLFVPMVVLLARLFLDTKIRSRKDIDDVGDIPLLADIPEVYGARKSLKDFMFFATKNKEEEESVPVIEYGNTSRLFKEAMRMMVTNLEFIKPERIPRPVILISSFGSGVGKSFIARNVAACLHDAGYQVVIVDCDMRRRTLSGYWGLKHRTVGLSNYLADSDINYTTIIHSNVMDGVDFVPAGHVPPNPVELLSRTKLDDFIATLRGRYDYVLMDGTPLNLVADAKVVGRVADMNLFVLRCGVSDRRILPLVKEEFQDERMKNMLAVLNGAEITKTYGGYGYGYDYGYGNGYYEDSK